VLVENVRQVAGSSSGSLPGDVADADRQPQRPDKQSQTNATAASRRTPGVSHAPSNWPRLASQ
jgi:hypothetical protein